MTRLDVQPSNDQSRSRARIWSGVALILMGLIYAGVFISLISEAYVDFGDGNYLYIARRLNEGVVLYRDILSPQPPIHVTVGAILLRVGEWLGSPLYTVRIFTMALHLFTMWIVARIARKLFGSELAGVCAAALYLLVPIGFWWTLGFQSEPFEMAFLLTSTLLFLDFSPKKMIAAGVLAACGPLCNMTALPFLIFNGLFLAYYRRWALLIRYGIPLVVIWGLVALGFEWKTGAFFQNVFFNQVGTFPPLGVDYYIDKIASNLFKVFRFEGAWIVWGIAGLFLLPRHDCLPWRAYASWLVVAGLLSIFFVAKGGTVEYIFTLGEPILCVTAGGLWGALFQRPRRGEGEAEGGVVTSAAMKGSPLWPASLMRRGALGIIVFLGAAHFLGGISYGQAFIRAAMGEHNIYIPTYGLNLIRQTLAGKQFEMSHGAVQGVKETITHYTQPGDPILAHPFFAFITDRRLVGEYSETFIWTIKYKHESEGLEPPGEGIAKVKAIAAELLAGRVPLVILDEKQTGVIPEIQSALASRYTHISTFSTGFNFDFSVYVPR